MCIYIYRTIYIYIKRTNAYAQKDEQKIVPTTLTQNLSSSPYSSPLLSENLRLRLRRKSKRENLFIILIFPGGGRGRDKRLWASIKTARKWNNSKIIITDLLGTTALYVPMLRTTATYSYIRTYHNSSFIVAKWYFFWHPHALKPTLVKKTKLQKWKTAPTSFAESLSSHEERR